MIVRLPNIPPLDQRGRFPRPLVVLIGGLNGSWQAGAARMLDRCAGAVIRTDVAESVPAWEMILEMIFAADVVVCWNGNGPDTLYLTEWLFAAVSAGNRLDLVVGIDPEPDHPMSNGLRVLLRHFDRVCLRSLDDVLTAAQERCRELRRIP